MSMNISYRQRRQYSNGDNADITGQTSKQGPELTEEFSAPSGQSDLYGREEPNRGKETRTWPNFKKTWLKLA